MEDKRVTFVATIEYDVKEWLAGPDEWEAGMIRAIMEEGSQLMKVKSIKVERKPE